MVAVCLVVAGEVLGGRFDGLVMEEFDDDTITALAKGLGLRRRTCPELKLLCRGAFQQFSFCRGVWQLPHFHPRRHNSQHDSLNQA